MCTTAAAPLFLQLSIADPSVKIVRSEFQLEMTFLDAPLKLSGLTNLLETPARFGKIEIIFIDCHCGLEMRWVGSLLLA